MRRMSTVTPLVRGDIKDRVSGEIKAWMARRGATQADVATHLGMSQSQFSKRLRGNITLDILEVQHIADYLRVPLEVLFGLPWPTGSGPDGPSSLPRLDSNQEPFGYLSPQVRRLLVAA
jgi:transcriptional regulator with XRE-family HTH domain